VKLRHPGLVLAASLVFFLGCHTLPPSVPLSPDDPLPRALVEAASRAAEARRGLRGRAQLEVNSETRDLHLRANLVVVLERPARLRVEVLGLLGQSVAVLVTDGVNYEWFETQTREYRSGEVHRELLWELVRIPLEIREIASLLLGERLPREGLALGAATRGGDEIEVELTDTAGVPRERIELDSKGHLLVEQRLDAALRVHRRAEFGDYATGGDVDFAREFEVAFPTLELRVGLTLRDVELNPEIPAGLYRLRAGATAGQ
jgi:hypothetical protein